MLGRISQPIKLHIIWQVHGVKAYTLTIAVITAVRLTAREKFDSEHAHDVALCLQSEEAPRFGQKVYCQMMSHLSIITWEQMHSRKAGSQRDEAKVSHLGIEPLT